MSTTDYAHQRSEPLAVDTAITLLFQCSHFCGQTVGGFAQGFRLASGEMQWMRKLCGKRKRHDPEPGGVIAGDTPRSSEDEEDLLIGFLKI